MIEVDWGLFLLGLSVGAVASVLFFVGLSFGMRIALKTAHPVAILLTSAGLRIALLLGAGWFVAKTGVWAFGGFAVSFLLVRLVVVLFARARAENGGT